MDYKKSTYKKKTAAPKVQYKPKRGKLAPLMSEDEKASAGIHELSYDFGCRITRLFQFPQTETYALGDQIRRSASSACVSLAAIVLSNFVGEGSK